jgi:hypothetical protein
VLHLVCCSRLGHRVWVADHVNRLQGFIVRYGKRQTKLIKRDVRVAFELVNRLPVDCRLRFSDPVTPDLICQPRPFASYKDALVPRRFSSNSLPPFFALTLHFPAPPPRSCLRPHRAPLTPCGPPSPTEPIGRGQWEICRSATCWLLFARRLSSTASLF